MSQFKNKEEYEKWKSDKQRQAQQKKADAVTEEMAHSTPITLNQPAVKTKSRKRKTFFFVAIGLVVLCPAIFFLWAYMTHGKLSGNIYAVMKSGDVKKAAGITVYLLKVDNPQAIIAEVDRLDSEYHKSMSDLFNKDLHGSDYLDESRRIEMEYKRLLNKYLLSKKCQETQTDVNGSYEFQKIPYDKYMLLATYKVFDNNIDWLLPVEINKKESKIDLTNNNTTYISIFHVE